MAHTQYPPVVVVDENDNEIGSAMLADAWEKGLYHRIVSVFVVDDKQRMLLQLRSPHVKIYPDCWDQAAGGHVDEGFNYDQTAKNEVAEELGLHNIPLKALGKFQSSNKLNDGRIINQFEQVYVAYVPHDITLKFESREINKVQWFAPAELKTHIAQHPEKFTSGLLHGLRKYFPDF